MWLVWCLIGIASGTRPLALLRDIMHADFNAYRIHQHGERIEARFERLRLEQLSAGEVVIRVSHSAINYKDALAATGAGRILRRYPLVGGIDLAGRVESSQVADLKPGQQVLVTGGGLSETLDGGYAEFARVPAEIVIPMPPGLDALTAMTLGTAGYTAARAIVRMEANGQTPDMGPILVTGASGGVGSIAIDMLCARGYQVAALSGKAAAQDYLRQLGAHQVLSRDALSLGSQPLEAARWGGGIDSIGGETLSWLLRSTRAGGSVASIGLAASAGLSLTVMPFILREVSLLGVNSVANTRASRLAIWSRIATDLMPRHLDTILTRTIAFADLPAAFDDYLHGRVIGRTVVNIATAGH